MANVTSANGYELKVGDKVRLDGNSSLPGEEGIVCVIDDDDTPIGISFKDWKSGNSCSGNVMNYYGKGSGWYFRASDLELIDPVDEFRFTTSSGTDINFYHRGFITDSNGVVRPVDTPCTIIDTPCTINKINNTMSIKSFIKNLTLSEDEKNLRKYGLKDECGEYSSEAKTAVLEKLTKENEPYLIEIANGLKAEDEKK